LDRETLVTVVVGSVLVVVFGLAVWVDSCERQRFLDRYIREHSESAYELLQTARQTWDFQEGKWTETAFATIMLLFGGVMIASLLMLSVALVYFLAHRFL
jgi:hypothetical protein